MQRVIELAKLIPVWCDVLLCTINCANSSHWASAALCCP